MGIYHDDEDGPELQVPALTKEQAILGITHAKNVLMTLAELVDAQDTVIAQLRAELAALQFAIAPDGCTDYARLAEIHRLQANVAAQATAEAANLRQDLAALRPATVPCKHCGMALQAVQGQRWSWTASRGSAIFCPSHRGGDAYHEPKEL